MDENIDLKQPHVVNSFRSVKMAAFWVSFQLRIYSAIDSLLITHHSSLITHHFREKGDLSASLADSKKEIWKCGNLWEEHNQQTTEK